MEAQQEDPKFEVDGFCFPSFQILKRATNLEDRMDKKTGQLTIFSLEGDNNKRDRVNTRAALSK